MSPVTVLFATMRSTLPVFAFRRALSLAGALDAKLEVLRVVRRGSLDEDATEGFSAGATLSEAESFFRSERELRDWVAQLVPEAPVPSEFHVEDGRFIEEVAQAAVDFSASLVVVPFAEGRHPAAIMAIMRLSGVAVLVVRPPFGEGVAAATDLARVGFPVVRRAALLADSLNSPLVVMHNVTRAPLTASLEASVYPKPEEILPMWARRAVLEAELRELAPGARPVVTNASSAVDAILEAAEEFKVDLVVVGAPMRTAAHTESVAEQVLRKAALSVLVTPLDETT
jgi:nucleotide-binding universal stress UspA family protein